MNKVKLSIGGSTYVVSCSENEDRVLELAEKLDSDMSLIMEQTPSASVTAAAVLCALTYLEKLDQSDRGADNMRMQIRQYLEEANSARAEAEKVKLELEKLKIDIQYLKNRKEGR